MNLTTKGEPIYIHKIIDIRKYSLSKPAEECYFFLMKVAHINHEKFETVEIRKREK